MRGGYGIYYDRHSGDYTETLEGEPPFSVLQIQSESANAGATLQSPFAPPLPAASSYPVFLPRVPGGFPFLQGLSPQTVDARTQEYDLNLQYALGGNYLFEARLCGNPVRSPVGNDRVQPGTARQPIESRKWRDD